jgi:integrase
MESSPSSAPAETPAAPQPTTSAVRRLPDRLDRPSPYGVFWRANGVPKKQFFKKAKARDAMLAELERAAKKGILALVPSRDDMRDWQAFKQATHPTHWTDVVAGWRAQLTQNKTKCDHTVQHGVDSYLEDMQVRLGKKMLSAGHAAHKDTMLQRFAAAFGPQKLEEVKPADVEQWITKHLGFTNPATFNSYLRALKALYRFYKREIPHSPLEDIHVRNDHKEVIETLTVAETAALFDYAQVYNRRALGRLALEAFAGLRFASAQKLEKQEINFDDRGILLPGPKLKTGVRRYVDGFPDNLWLWLAAAGDEGWDMTTNQWMHQKSLVFTGARLRHPNNCLRHSFCTHHVAAFKNPGLTATLLCHTSQQKLWSNYNGIATQEAGKLYWTITPATAKELATTAAKLKYPQLTTRVAE